MKGRWSAWFAAFVLTAGLSAAQTIALRESGDVNPATGTAVERNLTTLLNAFVSETSASGIPCAIKPPKLLVHDVASFGTYDPDTNTLTSPAWEQLTAQEQSIFYHAVGS